jgi:hypothetical protein
LWRRAYLPRHFSPFFLSMLLLDLVLLFPREASARKCFRARWPTSTPTSGRHMHGQLSLPCLYVRPVESGGRPGKGSYSLQCPSRRLLTSSFPLGSSSSSKLLILHGRAWEHRTNSGASTSAGTPCMLAESSRVCESCIEYVRAHARGQ